MANVETPKPESNQVEPSEDQTQAEISYQRADGTIEKATSSEEAIARCPYLGKLPLEQANVLLELSRKGQEMMAEASPKQEIIEPIKEVALAPKEKVPTITESKKAENINTVETVVAPEITTVLQEEYFNPEAVHASKELDTILNNVNETLLAPKVDRQNSVIEKVITEKIVNKPVVKEIVSEPVPQTSNLKDVPRSTEVIQVGQTDPIEIELHADEKLPVEESIVPKIQESTPELIVIQSNSETDAQPLPEVLTIIHEQTESKVKPDAEFEQLIEMINLPEANFIEIDISLPLRDTENYDQKPDIENSLVTVFESYINEQPDEETVPTIDQIKAKADNLPLEESLGQLVSLINEAAPLNESLMAEIFELTEIFAATEDEASIIKFDHEMLSRILSLLELIGYTNPEKSLLDLVERYDLRFLISAMRYLGRHSGTAARAIRPRSAGRGGSRSTPPGVDPARR